MGQIDLEALNVPPTDAAGQQRRGERATMPTGLWNGTSLQPRIDRYLVALRAGTDSAHAGASSTPSPSTRNVATSLFITGASGFIGRHLVKRLGSHAFTNVVCLSRTAEPGARGRVSWIRGDVSEPDSYGSVLDSSTIVLHMAATTGKAAADEHFRVNAEGTERLVTRCRERGVRGLLFVSSIAVAYDDVRDYPYARAKRRAEDAVRRSGVPHATVRPTVVLGRESPIWHRFRQLASGSIIPIVGDGRARMQPIHVDDLADCLLDIAANELFRGQTWGLGGPEALPISSFLARLHRLLTGREPRLLRIPHAPLRAALALAERAFHGFLPVTAGQLALFANDGTVEPNELLTRRWADMKDVDAMLQSLTRDDA